MNCFKIGQQVICIDDKLHPNLSRWRMVGDLDGLTKGCIYTIREILIDPLDQVVVVRLEEIIRSACPIIGDEASYLACRFRPLVNKKTDISIFTKILKDTKVEERIS